MPRYCYLCGKIEDPLTALHNFPANVNIRTLWIQACGLNENHDVSKIKICSKHFYPGDYIDINLPKSCDDYLKLHDYALPRKSVPNVIMNNEINIIPDENVLSDAQTTAICSFEYEKALSESEEVEECDSILDGDKQPTLQNYSNQANTSTRKGLLELRYQSDIVSSKRTIKGLSILRESLKRQKTIINNLHLRNRRLHTHITSLKKLVNTLRKGT